MSPCPCLAALLPVILFAAGQITASGPSSMGLFPLPERVMAAQTLAA